MGRKKAAAAFQQPRHQKFRRNLRVRHAPAREIRPAEPEDVTPGLHRQNGRSSGSLAAAEASIAGASAGAGTGSVDEPSPFSTSIFQPVRSVK